MKTWTQTWLLLAALTSNLFADDVRPPRVGIISDDGTRAVADLLLLELQNANVEMVARDEIARVLNEQELAAGGLTDKSSLAVGRLLRADGLVILDRRQENDALVKLVAVAPGVIIWLESFGSGKRGKPEADRQARAIAEALTAYLPKLSVKADDAIPLSMLTINEGIASGNAAMWAAQLHHLLQARLVKEPALFLLERDNLLRMEEEHRWAGELSAFWTGGYVLDGQVFHPVTSTETVKLRVDLLPPPGKGKTLQIATSGSSDNLIDLAERVATNVLAYFGREPTASTWDPMEEAKMYVRRAQNQRRPGEQRRSLESAMALGLRDFQTAVLYRKALESEITTEQDNRYGFPRFLRHSSTEELRQHARRIVYMLRFCQTYIPDDGFTDKQKAAWLQGAVAEYEYISPFNIAGAFLQNIIAVGRLDELGPLCEEIRREGRALAETLWFRDEYLRVARAARDDRFLRHARYFLDSGAEIVKLLYWYLDSSKPGSVLRKVPRITRGQIDPVFPADIEETAAARDRLWQAFKTRTEEEQDPGSRIDFMAEEFDALSHPVPRMWLREKMGKFLVEHVDFFLHVDLAKLYRRGFSCAFPAFAKHHYPDERAAIVRDTRHFLQGILKHRPLVDHDVTQFLDPFWDAYALEDARAVYAAIEENARAFEDEEAVAWRDPPQGDAAKRTVAKADPGPVLATIRARWPAAVSDSALKAERTRQEAEKQAEQEARQAIALEVTRLVEWPFVPPRKDDYEPTTRRGKSSILKWADGKLWFYHYGDFLAYDTDSRRVERLGTFSVPWDCRACPSINNSKDIRIEVGSSLIALIAQRASRQAFLAYRPREGGEWRTVTCQAYWRDILEADGNLYVTTWRKKPSRWGFSVSLLKLDPDRAQLVPVLDPLTVTTEDGEQQPVNFAMRMAFADGKLIIVDGRESVFVWNQSYYQGPFYELDLETKATRRVDKATWVAALGEHPPHKSASHRLGFDVVQVGPDALQVRHPGQRRKSPVTSIPLRGAQPIAGSCYPPAFTTNSLILRLAGNRPGLLELPYEDVRQWLERHTKFYDGDDQPQKKE